MKNESFLLLAFLFFISFSAHSNLTVTPSVSQLDCNNNNVTFTFSCNFSGTVLVVTNGGSGITFPNNSTGLATVTNGSLNLDVDVQSNAPTNFNIKFVVLASNAGCAVINDEAIALFNHTCILPVNNDCANAIPLNVSVNSCTYSTFATDNATASGQVPSGGGTGYDDLWYSFTALNTTATLEYSNLPGTFGYYGLYDGCPGSGGNELASSFINAFSGPGSIQFTGLTINATYIVQLLHLPNQSGVANQEICLHAPQPPCPTSIVISNGGVNLPNVSYLGCGVISTQGVTQVTTSGVTYEAPQVILNPGFSSGSGVFEAKASN